MKTEPPEIYVDFNARMTENGYLLVDGTLADLAELGLTPEQAVGMRFVFNGGLDANEHGEPADIMSGGAIIKDSTQGYLAVTDASGFFWRVHAAPTAIRIDADSPRRPS